MILKKVLLIVIIFSISFFAQDITFIPRQISVSDTMGKELVFYIDIKNISSVPQTVFIVRRINNLPNNWTSSLCLDYCFPPHIDSIATTPTFGSNQLQPNETREVSLHVYTSPTQPGQGNVRLEAGTFRNPTQIITRDFVATTFNPTSVEDGNVIKEFKLEQNYPNPFSIGSRSGFSGNPSTRIKWYSAVSGWQTLKVYNLLGVEVATLVDEYRSAGYHEVDFKAISTDKHLSSGVYFYQLIIGNQIKTKKMILEK